MGGDQFRVRANVISSRYDGGCARQAPAQMTPSRRFIKELVSPRALV